MSRYTLILIIAMLAPSAFVACDGSTLSTTKGSSETRRASLVENDTEAEAVEPDFDPIKFSEVPDQKVEPELQLSEAEWKKRLSKKEFHVLREGGTEHAFSGELLKNKREGVYVCGGCGKPLFSSETKFKSGTGWPSFYAPLEDSKAGLVKDTSHGMERVEVYCTHCGGHLGHVFNDGPAPTGHRYCLNSAALEFEAAADQQVVGEATK